MSERTVYPDWVQQHRVRGTTVKKVGNSYYLYKRTSRRVPGKKYPQPVDTYIGLITPDGVIEGNKRKISLSGIEVKEYGFSKTIWDICPDGWKKPLGEDWEDVLSIILVSWSPCTYLVKERTVKDESDYHYNFPAQKASLCRRIQKDRGIDLLKDLELLKSIYLLYLEKGTTISYISPSQQELLKRIGVNLEIC